MTECKILTPKHRRKLLRCVECGQKPSFFGWTDSIYPDEPELHGRRVVVCECGAFARCNGKFPGSAIGAPAGRETKAIRTRAYHAALKRIEADPVTSAMDRDAALIAVQRFLSAQLGVSPREARFDQLSAENAARALAVLA